MTYSPRSKSNRIGMTVTVFVYLYSGYVLYCPFYGGENALLEYIVTSLFTLAAALVSSSFFSKRKAAGKRHASPYFAVVISVILAVLSSAYIALYTSLLGIFGEDYPAPLAALFFAAVIIAGGVMGAEKGRICVLSFCRMVLLPLVTVAIAGCFAFFTTKSAFLLPSPFASFSDGEFFHLPLSIAYLGLDITFLSVILTDNESGEVRKASVQSVMKGTSLFVLFSGLCTAKNLMLFGEAYASEMISADLAALRLVPMFDLAEIAVVIRSPVRSRCSRTPALRSSHLKTLSATAILQEPQSTRFSLFRLQSAPYYSFLHRAKTLFQPPLFPFLRQYAPLFALRSAQSPKIAKTIPDSTPQNDGFCRDANI